MGLLCKEPTRRKIVKRILASLALVIVLWFLLIGSVAKHVAAPNFEQQAQSATGSLFVNDTFICSGTEIGHDGADGFFLTARHCVFDTETNRPTGTNWVSFSGNEHGPFYAVVPVAIASADDLAILRVVNGANIPEVGTIGDERALHSGDPIFNVSYPLGMGKLKFHGEFVHPNFEKVDERMLSEGWTENAWTYAMPVNLTIAHGSSGSGVFSTSQYALIGVAVGGSGEGTFNIVIPATRVKYLLKHLSKNSADEFIKAHAEKVVLPPVFFQ